MDTEMTVRRIAAGSYTVETRLGIFQVDRMDLTYGSDRYSEWFITWPGCRLPDGITLTLRDAKRMIAAELAPKE